MSETDMTKNRPERRYILEHVFWDNFRQARDRLLAVKKPAVPPISATTPKSQRDKRPGLPDRPPWRLIGQTNDWFYQPVRRNTGSPSLPTIVNSKLTQPFDPTANVIRYRCIADADDNDWDWDPAGVAPRERFYDFEVLCKSRGGEGYACRLMSTWNLSWQAAWPPEEFRDKFVVMHSHSNKLDKGIHWRPLMTPDEWLAGRSFTTSVISSNRPGKVIFLLGMRGHGPRNGIQLLRSADQPCEIGVRSDAADPTALKFRLIRSNRTNLYRAAPVKKTSSNKSKDAKTTGNVSVLKHSGCFSALELVDVIFDFCGMYSETLMSSAVVPIVG